MMSMTAEAALRECTALSLDMVHSSTGCMQHICCMQP
jgi:hypothetical protein